MKRVRTGLIGALAASAMAPALSAQEAGGLLSRLAQLETHWAAPWTAWAEEFATRDIFWFSYTLSRIAVEHPFGGSAPRVERCGRLRIELGGDKIDCAIAIYQGGTPARWSFYRFVTDLDSDRICVNRATQGEADWTAWQDCSDDPIEWVYPARETLQTDGSIVSRTQALAEVGQPFLRALPHATPASLADKLEALERTALAHDTFQSEMAAGLGGFTCNKTLLRAAADTAGLPTNFVDIQALTENCLDALADHVDAGGALDVIVPGRERRSCEDAFVDDLVPGMRTIVCELTIQDTDRAKPHREYVTYELIVADDAPNRQCREFRVVSIETGTETGSKDPALDCIAGFFFVLE
ncbi:hypothetical protein SAMN04488105_1306 [Salipiger thiooxidans]|uniref:SnoaL-like domain-containing protein n=1 Tax=Salipiger thiooxidans TaxID=282683 RepID=A0A1G7M673_9RHOB|nr:hypothetical protein [Salipiger thiooxidans]SDF57096.1 hypothetical protein SAMN04488105_1306 [Salipiger thiooxidans]